jgi:hypothetical protein
MNILYFFEEICDRLIEKNMLKLHDVKQVINFGVYLTFPLS